MTMVEDADVAVTPSEANGDWENDWKARHITQKVEEPNTFYELRNEYERDRSRLIHTPSFRRLQAKTQVLDIAEGDYHRTRLTHTMEVSQIGRGIVQRLQKNAMGDTKKYLPNNDLIEVIAFAHDIGHPPFGHNGEVALNYMMRDHGGFEGNGQSLRLLTWIEKRVVEGEEVRGLSPTRRTLLGILKYPRSYDAARKTCLPSVEPNLRSVSQSTWKPPKCYYNSEKKVVDWVLEKLSDEDRKLFTSWKEEPTVFTHGKTAHKSLDCSILELADDIAYATHDLEDGVALGFIKLDDLRMALDPSQAVGKDKKRIDDARDAWDKWSKTPDSRASDIDGVQTLLFQSGPSRRSAVSQLIAAFIHSVQLIDLSQKGFDSENPELHFEFENPLLRYRAQLPPGLQALLKILQDLAYKKVIHSAELQTLEYRGRIMIMEMFEALRSDPIPLLKETQRKSYDQAGSDTERMRVLSDFIAGMTDPYATRFYERLFVPRSGSAFDKL